MLENHEAEKEQSISTKMIGAEEVAQALNISKEYAYKVICKLNTDLEAIDYLVVKDKVSEDYFKQCFFGKDGVA